MSIARELNRQPSDRSAGIRRWLALELALLMALFLIYGGDAPPMVNEAHYLAQAKHFWQPDWCSRDLFLASGKAHATFYALFGWPATFLSFETSAWIGRTIGWLMLALGIQRLTWCLVPHYLASLGVAVLWIAGIEFGNFAGEWVVGGIEGKVPAYGLVLLGLAEMVSRRWGRVWIYFGAASAFHVLVGGWSVIAAAIAWWMTERGRGDREPLFRPALFVGGGLSLFGLVPALWLTAGATPEQSAEAARIYTYFRLPHHLLPTTFPWSWYVRHGLLIGVTAFAFAFARPREAPGDGAGGGESRVGGTRSGWNRLGWFVTAAIGFALCGLLIARLATAQPDLAARLLRYYWFRLTDVAVPLLGALSVIGLLVGSKGMGSKGTVGRLTRFSALAVLLVGVVAVGWSSYERMRIGVPPSVSHRLLGWNANASPEAQQRTFRDWLAVCRWIHATTPQDELFLTPRHQQTFKWYAGRAEVVNWKDVPQDAESLQTWTHRFTRVFPQRLGTMRVSIQYATLREFREEFGVRYMVVDRRVTGVHLPLVKIYPREPERNDTYAIYELPR